MKCKTYGESNALPVTGSSLLHRVPTPVLMPCCNQHLARILKHMFALSSHGTFHHTTHNKLSKALLKGMTDGLWENQHCSALLQRLVWGKDGKKRPLKLLLIGWSILVHSTGNSLMVIHHVWFTDEPRGREYNKYRQDIAGPACWPRQACPPELLRVRALSKGQYHRAQSTPADTGTAHSLTKSKVNL